MIILTIRTDKPKSEVGLYRDTTQLGYTIWEANRQLSVTIHAKIEDLLTHHGMKLQDIQGIVCFKGPGSFTGLRIGLTVANALAYAVGAKVVAREDPRWLETGLADILAGKNDELALPEYGSGVYATPQKK